MKNYVVTLKRDYTQMQFTFTESEKAYKFMVSAISTYKPYKGDEDKEFRAELSIEDDGQEEF